MFVTYAQLIAGLLCLGLTVCQFGLVQSISWVFGVFSYGGNSKKPKRKPGDPDYDDDFCELDDEEWEPDEEEGLSRILAALDTLSSLPVTPIPDESCSPYARGPSPEAGSLDTPEVTSQRLDVGADDPTQPPSEGDDNDPFADVPVVNLCDCCSRGVLKVSRGLSSQEARDAVNGLLLIKHYMEGHAGPELKVSADPPVPSPGSGSPQTVYDDHPFFLGESDLEEEPAPVIHRSLDHPRHLSDGGAHGRPPDPTVVEKPASTCVTLAKGPPASTCRAQAPGRRKPARIKRYLPVGCYGSKQRVTVGGSTISAPSGTEFFLLSCESSEKLSRQTEPRAMPEIDTGNRGD